MLLQHLAYRNRQSRTLVLGCSFKSCSRLQSFQETNKPFHRVLAEWRKKSRDLIQRGDNSRPRNRPVHSFCSRGAGQQQPEVSQSVDWSQTAQTVKQVGSLTITVSNRESGADRAAAFAFSRHIRFSLFRIRKHVHDSRLKNS